MRRHTQYALAFALALALTVAAVGAAWALPANPYTSGIHCAFWPYTNQLTAEVTQNPNGSYHYAYTLVFSESALFDEPLTDFSVGNLGRFAYTNPGCDYAFVMADSQDSVYWNIAYGVVPVGNTVHFWYDSAYSYGLVGVTISGGLPSDGTTLGMVPEPCSLLSIAFGLGGILCTRLRRRS